MAIQVDVWSFEDELTINQMKHFARVTEALERADDGGGLVEMMAKIDEVLDLLNDLRVSGPEFDGEMAFGKMYEVLQVFGEELREHFLAKYGQR